MLNICYTDENFQPVKHKLDEGLQRELNQLQNMARLREAPVPTSWTFRGVPLLMQEKGARGQWCLSRIIVQVRLSSEYLCSCGYLAEAIVEVELFLCTLFGYKPFRTIFPVHL